MSTSGGKVSLILTMFYFFTYIFAYSWSVYYLPKSSYQLGWIVDSLFMGQTIIMTLVGLWILIAILAKYWDIKENAEKYWIIGINIPIILSHLGVLSMLLLTWNGIVTLTPTLFAYYISGISLFSMFGIPFVIGFYSFILKKDSLSKYAEIARYGLKGSKLKEILFGISAILIFLVVLVLFVGQYFGIYGILL